MISCSSDSDASLVCYDGLLIPDIPQSTFRRWWAYVATDSVYTQKVKAMARIFPRWSERISANCESIDVLHEVLDAYHQQVEHIRHYKGHMDNLQKDMTKVR